MPYVYASMPVDPPLDQFRLDIYGKGDASGWRAFVREALRLTDDELSRQEREGGWEFGALFERPTRVLAGMMHLIQPPDQDGDTFHLVVHQLDVPADAPPPPAALAESSNRIGGAPAILDRFGELWPDRIVRGRAALGLRVDANAYRLVDQLAAPPPIPLVLDGYQGEAIQQVRGWDFRPSFQGMMGLTVMNVHDKNEMRIIGGVEWERPLTRDLLVDLEQQGRRLLMLFLRPR